MDEVDGGVRTEVRTLAPEDLEQVPGAGLPGVLVHMDAYRLSGVDEFVAGLWDADGQALRAGAAVVIEWGDLVAEALGADVLWLELTHVSQGREIDWRCEGSWIARSAAVAKCFD